MPITLFTALAHVCTYVRGAFGLEKLNNHNNQNNFTMRKFTLFFAALLVALGITAQTTTYPEGYFDFATEYLTMEECDQNATFGEGMLIAIQHNHSFHTDATEGHDEEGKFLIMETKETSGVHKMIMNDHLSGLGAFTLVEADGGFKLKAVRDGHWVGKLSTTADNLKTTKYESNAGVYKFTWHEGFGYSVDCVNASSSSSSYSLYVNTSNGTTSISGGPFPSNIAGDSNKKVRAQVLFKIHKVSNPKGVTKYVENAKVELTGPGGNVFTTTHSGWSDFYEFVQNSSVYNSTENFGVTLSNVMYHEATNEITGNIHFPFPVSGDVVKIPVVLNPAKNTSRRIAANKAGDGLEVQTNSADVWAQDLNNQWGIIPNFVNGFYLEYAIQNVATGTYITVDASNNVTLGADPYYFKLTGGTDNGKITDLRFKKNSTSSQYLYDNNGTVGMNYYASEGAQFKVDRVPANELSGADAKGFTRYYKDKLFWDCGAIDWSKAPKALLAVLQDGGHEGYAQGGHTLYAAETGCRVPKTGDITVTFNFSSGSDMLQILGVDVVAANGTVLNSDYHVGKAGNPSAVNKYTIKDIPAGENYTVRYWVCNYSNGHDLTKNQGNIVVTGADYYVKYSNAPANGAWAANTTWFRMRLHDDCTRYISAQPAYMDADNNLKLTNDTPPTDYAGMWAVVGNATDGYKFYNHAWGPEYALKTTGSETGARTFMAPVAEATTYDVVSGSDYKFFVKVHGSDNNYLNMRGDYLALWNNTLGLGDQGSVMTFETVDMEAFEANTEKMIKDNLLNYYIPWTACDEITVPANTDFVSLMKGRKAAAEALDGKLFKFANKGSGDRIGRFLGINANGESVGLKGTTTMDGFVQLIHNGDLTFKLYHPATGKYFGTPGNVVDAASNAANYTFQVYGDEIQTVVFVTGNQMIHMYNYSPYSITNYNDIADGASRWTVSCDDTMQELVDLLAEAKAKYATVSAADYQANIGVPGYATTATIDALKTAIDNALVATDYAAALTDLQNKKQAVITEEVTPLFPTDCYFTITDDKPNRGSIIYNSSKTDKNKENGVDDFLWHTNSVDKTNADHLWCFYQEPVTGEYYLYNVGKKQFANPYGKGSFTGEPGYTWVFSNTPAAITMSALDEYPYFHIQGGADKLTMSVSTAFVGSVITYYEKKQNGTYDGGMYFKFAKSDNPVSDEVTNAIKALSEAYAESQFNEAKAAAEELLATTPEAVGYPVAAERTAFETAIASASDISTIEAAVQAFKETTSVNMPESGKAYVFTNVHSAGGKKYLNYAESGLTMVARGDGAANDLPESAKWYCRMMESGQYVFVNSAGKYLVFKGSNDGTNGNKGYVDAYDKTYSPITFVKMTTSSYTGSTKLEDLFGYVAFGGRRIYDGKSAYFVTEADGDFQQDTGWTLRYDNSFSTAFLVEEVSNYVLANTKLTTVTEDDGLLKGIEVGQTIGTFSAPYATVIPGDVTAYYAKSAQEEGTLNLKAVEGNVLPAGEGVVLIGGKSVNVAQMLPVAGENVATISGNEFEHSATGPVTMGANAYILANGGQGIGIYKATAGTTLKQGKAYLDFGTSTVARFVLNFSGVATDIEGAPTVAPSQQVIYDLSGRRVNAVTKGGIYIVNGKKMIIK